MRTQAFYNWATDGLIFIEIIWLYFANIWCIFPLNNDWNVVNLNVYHTGHDSIIDSLIYSLAQFTVIFDLKGYWTEVKPGTRIFEVFYVL